MLHSKNKNQSNKTLSLKKFGTLMVVIFMLTTLSAPALAYASTPSKKNTYSFTTVLVKTITVDPTTKTTKATKAKSSKAKAKAKASKVKAIKSKHIKAKSLTRKDQNVTPKITVKINGKKLKVNRDYKLAIYDSKNNKVQTISEGGTYKAVVKGIKRYKGTASKKFKVRQMVQEPYYEYVTKTRTVTVVDKEAWDEEISEIVKYVACHSYTSRNYSNEYLCHYKVKVSDFLKDNTEFLNHLSEHQWSTGYAAYGIAWIREVVGTVHHPAETHEEKVPYTERIVKYRWV